MTLTAPVSGRVQTPIVHAARPFNYFFLIMSNINAEIEIMRKQRDEAMALAAYYSEQIAALQKLLAKETTTASTNWADMSSSSSEEEVEDDSGWTTVGKKAPHK